MRIVITCGALALVLGSVAIAGEGGEGGTRRPAASPTDGAHSPAPKAEAGTAAARDNGPARPPLDGGPGDGPGGPGGPFPPLDRELYCAPEIADQALPGAVLQASTDPVLGALHPLGVDLFVDPAGRVGVGTLSPATALHVAGGDLNLEGGALRVRTAPGSVPMEIGTSAAQPRPHLVDGFTSILGGAAPEATFDIGDWALRATDGTLGAHLELGLGGATQALLHADGPQGASLELDVGGDGHVLSAEAGLGAALWSVTGDGLSGTIQFDGGAQDRDGRLEIRDGNGDLTVELDSESDAFSSSGAELSLRDDAGVEVVELMADAAGGASLDLNDTLGRRIGLYAGGSTGAPAGLTLFQPPGDSALSLAARLGATGGGTLEMRDAAQRKTLQARATSSLNNVTASLSLTNHAATPFTAVRVKVPEPFKSPVLELESDGGGAITLYGRSAPGSTGGGLEIKDANGVVRAEMFDGVFTLFDSTGDPTIVHDANAGTKSAVVRPAGVPRRVYCNEAAEVWFEDAGVARLVDGRAEVPLDPVWLQTVVIDDAHPLHVSASARGASRGVWVEVLPERIVLHELPGGPGDGLVDWRVQARRAGLEDARLEPFGG